jgi:hypothetical protein
MSEPRKLDRRTFIQSLAAVFGAGAVLSACGGRDDAPATAGTDPCDDVSGLTEDQIQTREGFDYVGQTPYPEQRCDNCHLWVEPAANQVCGGCTIIAGPINPAGWCTAWVPTAT